MSECPGLRALPGRRRLAPNPGDAFSLSLFTFFLEGEIQGEKLRDLGCNLFLEKGHSQVESAFFQDHFGWRGGGSAVRGGQEEAAAVDQTHEEDSRPGRGPGRQGSGDQIRERRASA